MRKILFLLVLLLSISNLVKAGGPTPDYLTFTSNQDGSEIGFENLPKSVNLFYSTDGGVNWNPATSSTSIPLNAGESVQFYGDNSNGLYDENLANIPPASPGAPLPPQPETQFKITGDVSVSGDINTLINKTGGDIELQEKNYYKLFEECDITDASGLILPSQELAESCYERMFYNCKKLIKAPELPATQLANSCYYYMFGGCNALTQAPELPATTLASSCYEYMFYKCGLTAAPELPATVMKDYCYYAMFSGCESLTEAPELPATQLAYSCYYYMFISCKALTQAPELPATQLADRCYFDMFGYCESLTHAPFLPATTLASECYNYIFVGCNNLEYVEVAFTDWGENNKYTKDWLNYTPSSGTFVCPESLDKSKTGSSGIPDGWKTQNYVDYLTFTSNKNGSEIVFCEFGSGVNLEYSTDRINWYSAGKNTKITLPKGKSVIFRGENAKEGLKQTQFKITGDVSVSGDINTLINKTGGDIKLAGQCYQNLFFECNGLTDASKLKLPSTTLTFSAACYLNMFKDCSYLVYAPELPATTLASECYKSMFDGCTKLALAPELPATTLATSCYESMFVGCKALKSAPVLPADELVDNCYGNMFNGCSSLNKIEVAFTEWKSSCTENWVKNVASEGLFICPTVLDQTKKGVNNIPEGWKIESPTAYLTFTSKEDGSTVGFDQISSVVSELYYRVDGSDWVEASNLKNNPVTLNYGNKIQFYGNNENGLSKEMGDRTQFSVTGKVSVSGDLNTLMTKTGGDVDLKDCNYYYLFEDCKGITDASKLSLPSTTMKYKCYYGLFYNCASLTSAPKLPAKNLSLQCYESMFSGCSALTAAPELPATTLAMSCYRFMFSGCTSLTSAPYLPATTLSEGCYYKMFENCSDLCEIQVDFTSWDNSNTTEWVKNVSRSGVFICLNTLEQIIDDSHIPKGWVVENPLTFTSNKDGSEIGFAQIASGAKIQYNDGTGWKDASELINNLLSLNSGEYVMFKGDYSGATLSNSNFTQFAITGDVSASGDINSLTNGKGGNINLKNKNYYKLFTDCAGLTDASGLKMPSTTLANYCYQYMFLRCTALTSAPALPAKILAESCYEYMYYDCSALTTAPELPAETLVKSCYYQMFKGCSKLKEITVAFTDWNNSSNATYEWVDGVAETGAFICPSELEDVRGTSNIPTKWKCPEFLTFTSNQDVSTIGFVKIADGAKIEYNDGTGWKDATELKTTPLTLNNGQFVKFRGDYNNVTTSKTVYTQFDIIGNVSASGDVNTLIDGKGGDIVLKSNNYSRMFMECAGLTDASGLKLPSKTMSESCCYQMFAACSALTKAPGLKATQMATRCYQEMFNLCTSLTEAPNELPATNLADYCYADMFHSCRALLQGPTLPATDLSEGCYSYMFYDCTSLLAIPALRATTLAKNCYKSMFKNCSSLFYVSISDCLSAFDNNYTSEWLSGVASVGIFICRDITQVSDIKRGANYIPKGWYVGSYYVALSEDNINEGLSLSKSKYYNKDLEGMLAKIPAYQQMPDINIDNMYSMDDTIKVNPENYEIYDMFYQSSPAAAPNSVDYDKTNNTFAVSSLQNRQLVITISGSILYQVKYYSNDMELGTEIDQNDKTPFVFRKGAKKSDLKSFSIDGCYPEIYTDAECTKQLGEDEFLVSYCDNGLVKLYKKTINYTITFDTKGNNTINPITYTVESETIDLSSYKGEKDYYTFAKWVDGSNNEVKQIAKGSFGDITLTAIYTPTQYSITFDVDGGKPIDSLTYTIVSENIDLSTIKPEKEGYHFIKWIDDKDAEVTQIVKGSNGNVALTAQFEAHSFGKWDTTLVATCTTLGMRSHHCSCGAFENDTIAELPHTIVIDTLVPSTCTHWGLKEGSHCSVCKTVLVKQDTIEALGHKVVTDAAVTATCTHFGLKEGSHCSVCKTVLVKQDTIEALGHSFTLYVYNDDATTEADGTKTAACDHEGCDETDTQVAVGTKLEPTLSEKTEGDKFSIYTFDCSIVVENADADINVYDVTGRLVAHREGVHFVSERIEVPNIGVYVVKCGDVVRRVLVK
ncbi:MAG: leucine-rich repeat protein [Paludibacteraceae bacterium]|nr:leucine-rich repeat protein [Paludibacteraceae bacterium]